MLYFVPPNMQWQRLGVLWKSADVDAKDGIDVSYHRYMFAPLIGDQILRLRYVLYEVSGGRLEDIRYAYNEDICPVLERALSRQLQSPTSSYCEGDFRRKKCEGERFWSTSWLDSWRTLRVDIICIHYN